MKKLILIPALILGFAITANAQTDAAAKSTTTKETVTTTTKEQKEYKKIEPSEVDNVTLKNVLTKYKGSSILEAHKAEDGEYKLILTKGGKNTTAYFAKSGEFIKEA